VNTANGSGNPALLSGQLNLNSTIAQIIEATIVSLVKTMANSANVSASSALPNKSQTDFRDFPASFKHNSSISSDSVTGTLSAMKSADTVENKALINPAKNNSAIEDRAAVGSAQPVSSMGSAHPDSAIVDISSAGSAKPVSNIEDRSSVGPAKPFGTIEDRSSVGPAKPISTIEDRSSVGPAKPFSTIEDRSSVGPAKPFSTIEDRSSVGPAKPSSTIEANNSKGGNSTTTDSSSKQELELLSVILVKLAISVNPGNKKKTFIPLSSELHIELFLFPLLYSLMAHPLLNHYIINCLKNYFTFYKTRAPFLKE
jgi:hypothetical protein